MEQPGQKSKVVLKVSPLPGRPDLPLPRYMTEGAAGMDLVAVHSYALAPGERVAIGTGFAIALPEGYEAQIRPRSGLALKHGVTVLNAPGTIDWDYRGEVKVILVNLGSVEVMISAGDRIAQLVVSPVYRAELRVVAQLDDTVRGQGGFGHTGR